MQAIMKAQASCCDEASADKGCIRLSQEPLEEILETEWNELRRIELEVASRAVSRISATPFGTSGMGLLLSGLLRCH